MPCSQNKGTAAGGHSGGWKIRIVNLQMKQQNKTLPADKTVTLSDPRTNNPTGAAERRQVDWQEVIRTPRAGTGRRAGTDLKQKQPGTD